MNSTRRNFIRNTALTAIGISAFPAILKARSANEKIQIGLIGCNETGFKNLVAFLKQSEVECGAICDVDRNVPEKWAMEVERIQGSRPVLYYDYRKLLENRDIDAVINAGSDYINTSIAINAMESGKALYTESLMASSIQEFNLMVAMQKRYKTVVQTGQWLRSNPQLKEALVYLQTGNLGKIQMVRAWHYGDKKDSFGFISSQEINLLDYALSGINKFVPESVMATGRNFEIRNSGREIPDTLMINYDFDNVRVIWDHAYETKNKYSLNRKEGVVFTCENGKIIAGDFGSEVYTMTNNRSEKILTVHNPEQNGLERHIADFLKCIKTGEKPNCDVESVMRVAQIAQIGMLSYQEGRKIYRSEIQKELEKYNSATT